jgi:hypothetical protein
MNDCGPDRALTDAGDEPIEAQNTPGYRPAPFPMAPENERSTISDALSFCLIKPARKYRSMVFCSSATAPSSIGVICVFARLRGAAIAAHRRCQISWHSPGIGVLFLRSVGPGKAEASRQFRVAEARLR